MSTVLWDSIESQLIWTFAERYNLPAISHDTLYTANIFEALKRIK